MSVKKSSIETQTAAVFICGIPLSLSHFFPSGSFQTQITAIYN